jgi:hypothetical protein
MNDHDMFYNIDSSFNSAKNAQFKIGEYHEKNDVRTPGDSEIVELRQSVILQYFGSVKWRVHRDE